MHLELIILEGTQAGRHIPVAQTPVTFGRSSAAGMSFPLDSFMSGMHLTVQHALSGVILVDLRSSNGTFLNGKRISQAMAVPGDVIKIGALSMKLALGRATAPEIVRPVEPASAELTAATNVMQAFQVGMGEPVSESVMEPAAEPFAEAVAQPVAKEHPVLVRLRQLELPLFCLIDPGIDGVIPSLLAAAPDRNGCIYEGGDGVASGPYLVQINFDSTLLKILMDDGWVRGWASFFTSVASFEEIREHFGKFYRVQIEAGGVYFRFYHSEVLREFLPVASKAELEAFFGPVAEWLLETEDGVGVLRATIGGGGLLTEASEAE